jgi:hypothetical protein
MFHNIAVDRSRLWAHGSLALLLCLLAASIAVSVDMVRTNYPGTGFETIFVVVLLIINHIQSDYTKQGAAAKVMKVLARGWLVLTIAYITWALWATRG